MGSDDGGKSWRLGKRGNPVTGLSAIGSPPTSDLGVTLASRDGLSVDRDREAAVERNSKSATPLHLAIHPV